MKKKNIALLTGGDSSEYVISLQSAEFISQSIDNERFNVYTVLVKGDEWTLTSGLYCDLIVNKNDFSFNYNGQKVKFDLAFIAIHGTPGENGLLQSYFEMLGTPYTTSGVLASALSFNKFACNIFLQNFGIEISPSVLLRNGQSIDIQQIIKKIGFPCFVKPNQGGSSFGISKVHNEEQLMPAIEKAFHESKEVIVEKFISGREITCGLMKISGKEYIFPLTEIVTENEFFDYAAKYTPALVDEITPAPISVELTENCKQISSQIYDALNCAGLVRVDYILTGEKLVFLEINMVPGMTKNSLVPKQLKAAKMPAREVFSLLIDDAFYRHQKP